MEKSLDMSGYTAQEKLVYGYLGEILLNVWVRKNNLVVSYCDAINTEVVSPNWKDKVRAMSKKQLSG